jgi:tetratricopeptide (TPR) repeat protein
MDTMSKNNQTRSKGFLFLAVSLSIVVALVIGFYLLRNKIADRLEFIYFARGTELSKPAADKLELDLKSDSDNFADRIELLAFYSFKTYKDGLTPEDLMHRRAHIFWVIEHEPSSTFASDNAAAFGAEGQDHEGLEEGGKLWLQQVKASPRNARILYNAGRFFGWTDGWSRSEELLEGAYAIEPQNHDIASFLAGLYWRDARHSSNAEQVRSEAAKSLGVYERALSDTNDQREQLNDLPEAAQAAFEAGEYEKAGAYSKKALNLAAQPENVADSADAGHYGNIVLGRIAVRQGDVAGGSAYLLKSAAIKGNPHLDTFGPNMMLAKELLEKGERTSVLQYFDLCGAFWKDDDGKLKQWRSSVASGTNPDFGANLRY